MKCNNMQLCSNVCFKLKRKEEQAGVISRTFTCVCTEWIWFFCILKILHVHDPSFCTFVLIWFRLSLTCVSSVLYICSVNHFVRHWVFEIYLRCFYKINIFIHNLSHLNARNNSEVWIILCYSVLCKKVLNAEKNNLVAVKVRDWNWNVYFLINYCHGYETM